MGGLSAIRTKSFDWFKVYSATHGVKSSKKVLNKKSVRVHRIEVLLYEIIPIDTVLMQCYINRAVHVSLSVFFNSSFITPNLPNTVLITRFVVSRRTRPKDETPAAKPGMQLRPGALPTSYLLPLPNFSRRRQNPEKTFNKIENKQQRDDE